MPTAGPGGETGVDRVAVEREIERLHEASECLRGHLAASAEVSRELIAAVHRGDPLDGTLQRLAFSQWRPTITAALAEYERARRRARLGLMALAAAQGMTVDDVASHWAITKQLAARSLRDATEGP